MLEYDHSQINSAQWQVIADSINDGLLVNVNQKHVYANRRIEQMLEYAPGELLGTTVETVVHPDHRTQISERWRNRLRGEAPPRVYETAFVTKNGVKIPVELSVSVLPWEGQQAGVVTIRDISERRRHLEQIRRSSRLLEYFFKDSHTCFALVDHNLNFTRVNKAFADLFARDPEFFPGKSYSQFFPRDRQTMLEQVRDRGITCTVAVDPLPVTRGAAEPGARYCNWSAIPLFDDAGRVEYVGLSLTDISEIQRIKLALEQREQELIRHRDNLGELVRQRTGQLQESEARFRRMADSAPSLIWLADENDQTLWFNKSWLKYTGCEPAATYREGWLTYVHPQDLAKCKEVYDQAWQQHQGFSLEHRLRRHNGSYGWITIVGVPRLTDTGDFEGYIGYCWDITELKRTEFELSAAREQAEDASHAKSEFLSRMSHELRTPLNAVLGFAQLLQTDMRAPLLASQGECVAEILRAGYHLLELITEILDLSHIESGRIQMNPVAVNLEHVLGECVSLVTPMADKRGIVVAYPRETVQGVTVSADTIRLKQVLLNLLSNAVKYNRELGRIDIDVAFPTASGVRISVRDTGRGIDAGRFSEIFTPFNRLGAETTNIEGTGIGLVITKRLVEMMGGGIGFDSLTGVGTTFWIDLNRTGVAPAAVEGLLPAMTVLYLDADPGNARQMEDLLGNCRRMRLLTASDAAAAQRLAGGDKPDVLLVDWHQGGAPAGDFLHRLVPAGLRGVPVIAIGDTADAAERELAEHHVHAYLPRQSLPTRLLPLLEGLRQDVA